MFWHRVTARATSQEVVPTVILTDTTKMGDKTMRQITYEAVKAFLPVIMKKLKITNIYGICLTENIASQKVLEKCGFILECKGLSNYQNVERLIHKYKYSI